MSSEGSTNAVNAEGTDKDGDCRDAIVGVIYESLLFEHVEHIRCHLRHCTYTLTSQIPA